MQRLFRQRFHILYSVTLVALLSLSTVAWASPAPPAAPSDVASASPGLRAYIDPETGELTESPSPAQVEQLNRSLELSSKRSSPELRSFELRFGGTGLFLDDRFHNALVAHRSEDGNYAFRCAEEEAPQEATKTAPSKTRWPEK